MLGSHRAFAQAPKLPDFNGDGFADLATGVPAEDVGTKSDAGAVILIYGRSGGLNPSFKTQLRTQDSDGAPNTAEAGDGFGEAVTWGDFNSDGFSDLAVGVPYEDRVAENQGAVNVLYGSPSGLRSDGNDYWDQETSGVPGEAQAGDRFGWALAAGDFDRDGFDDLAIGVIGDVVTSRPVDGSVPLDNAGGVNVLYGGPGGLTAGNAQLWTQESPNVHGELAEVDDMFGWSLASGDLDGDRFDDLIVGAPWEDGSYGNSGVVHMFPGSPSGVTDVGHVYFLQGQQGIPDENCPNPDRPESCQELTDLQGWSVSAGDYNGDGFDDLAYGVPGEDNGATNAGQVQVIYGSANGPVKRGSQYWNQNRPGIADSTEFADHFGSALTSGDFDGDGFDDLVIGVPGERLEEVAGAIREAGAVHVLYGSGSRLTGARDKVWSQNEPFVEDIAERGDRFGSSLGTGNFDGDRYADLVVGVPQENVSALADAGAVNVLYGTSTGFTGNGSDFWNQDSPGVPETAATGDVFGEAATAE